MVNIQFWAEFISGDDWTEPEDCVTSILPDVRKVKDSEHTVLGEDRIKQHNVKKGGSALLTCSVCVYIHSRVNVPKCANSGKTSDSFDQFFNSAIRVQMTVVALNSLTQCYCNLILN